MSFIRLPNPLNLTHPIYRGLDKAGSWMTHPTGGPQKLVNPYMWAQGLGPHGALGELAAPFVGGGRRIAQGRPPTLAQMALVAGLVPGKVGATRGVINPYSQMMPRPRVPARQLTPQQMLAIRYALLRPGGSRLFT